MKTLNRSHLSTLMLTLVACLLPLASWAAANPVIEIRNGYVRGLPPGTTNTSAYMTLINKSDQPMVLTGATTPAANSVMIHKSVRRQGGVMGMEHVMSVALPARGTLELKTGATHLMLMGLKRQLRDGNNVKLTLQFEGGFSMTVDLPVISVLNE